MKKINIRLETGLPIPQIKPDVIREFRVGDAAEIRYVYTFHSQTKYEHAAEICAIRSIPIRAAFGTIGGEV